MVLPVPEASRTMSDDKPENTQRMAVKSSENVTRNGYSNANSTFHAWWRNLG